MTLFRGTVLDTPEDPFTGAPLRAEADAGLLVRDGVLLERGPFAQVRGQHPDEEVVDLTGGAVLPGLVDTHVHFPQVRAIGGLGMPLLDWLERCALPEEARLADVTYAASVAAEFVDGLVQAGTTTALVFGAHFAPAVEELFQQAARVGLRITSGLVVSDRILREDLLTTPERAYHEGLGLAERWHGKERNRYAVIPRFSLSCDKDLLDACGALLRDVPGSWFTSHINENVREIETVTRLFGLGTYQPLPGDNSRIFAHIRTWEDDVVLCVHNLARSAQAVQLDLSEHAGMVPVEMLGRTAFPPIGELPYLLTLAPRGFFWFQLRQPGQVE